MTSLVWIDGILKRRVWYEIDNEKTDDNDDIEIELELKSERLPERQISQLILFQGHCEEYVEKNWKSVI